MKKNEFLEKLRKDLGYSRKKIGEYLEISPSTIEKYEKGRLDFNHKTKYVLGICALAGYDNEIFMFDKIDNKTIEKLKLTLFSSKLREILYFFDIEYEMYESFLIKLLQKFFPNDMELKNKIYKYLINSYESIDNIFEKKFSEGDLILSFRLNYNNFDIFAEFINKLFLQLAFIAATNFFSPKYFYNDVEIKLIYEILNDNLIEEIFEEINQTLQEDNLLSLFFTKIQKSKISYINHIIKELDLKGKPVNKETIKEFKIELETGAILSTCNEPTDPKDKQICELLQYAPPAFKDKIIEKLLQYKKDIEEL